MTKKQKKLEEEFLSLYSETRNVSIGNIINKFRIPHQEAEDLYQKAYTKAYTKLSSFKGNSSLKTWIYRIIQNATLDFFRRPYVKCETGSFVVDVDDSTFIKELQDHCNNPSQLTENKEHINILKVKIQNTLSKLSPKHQEIINLIYSGGASYEDVAKRLKCSIGTVMSRAFYARKHFVKLYPHAKELVND